MVGITIQCRLGNQLFQYAFIRSLAKQLKTNYFLNESFEKFILAKYFELDGYNPLKMLLSKAAYKLKNNPIRKLQSLSVAEYRTGILDELGDNNIYNGYFQSPEFFSYIEKDIRQIIKVKPIYQQAFTATYGATFQEFPVIAVHIRRGDYSDLGDWWLQQMGSSDLTLPEKYFRQCLKRIDDLDKYRIIFVSDDMEYVRNTFGDIKNAEFQDNNIIIDFQAIMNADICIISNSSFAWWAAYLNSKPLKQVYCPKYWLGFKVNKEYPKDVIPIGWNRVSVE